MILAGCSTTPEVVKKTVEIDKSRDYLEDSKMYFNFGEYEKAIANALIVYHHIESPSQKEEALYIINESAEEIVLELDRAMYIESISNIPVSIASKNIFSLSILCIIHQSGYARQAIFKIFFNYFWAFTEKLEAMLWATCHNSKYFINKLKRH